MSRRKKFTQKDVIEGLGRLAFGDIQDAITLLFETEENILSVLPKLNLFNISEIKRPKGGGMEIKFFDRIKALEKLREVIGTDDRQTAVSFYEALEKSTAGVKEEYGEDFDE
ncbi:MAG: terminase small subunit [Eubacterium sp.]